VKEKFSFIDEAESVKPAPFAFSFAQEDMTMCFALPALRAYPYGVSSAFRKQKPMDENVGILKKVYHGRRQD
jgi:hypothetical protein